MQQVQSGELAGKPVELNASMKTSGVGEKGWVMLMTFKHYNNAIEQFRSEPMIGDTDWSKVQLRKQAPANTTAIEVGFILLDGGTGWADGVQLQILDDAESEAGSSAGKPPSEPVKAARPAKRKAGA
jgi:hypothetical protein